MSPAPIRCRDNKCARLRSSSKTVPANRWPTCLKGCMHLISKKKKRAPRTELRSSTRLILRPRSWVHICSHSARRPTKHSVQRQQGRSLPISRHQITFLRFRSTKSQHNRTSCAYGDESRRVPFPLVTMLAGKFHVMGGGACPS